MENIIYSQLIRNNELDKILEMSFYRTFELTENKHLGKYILEYLLEKNMHTKSMDNYTCYNFLWIKLYIKYNIIEPLVKTNLNELLKIDGDTLLLDRLLKKFNEKQKLELYQNMKKDNYWLFMQNEALIRKIYLKYNIKLDSIFLGTPTIYDKNITSSNKINELITEFKKVYKDHDEITLNSVINELKRKSKIDRNRTISDIMLLIDYKKKYKKFKLITKNVTIEEDENIALFSSSDKKLIIDQYSKDTFNHELSHLLYDDIENAIKADYIFEFDMTVINDLYHAYQSRIRRKNIEKITNYLKDFHKRYDYMENIFKELYYKEINIKYGSLNNYAERILCDIIGNNLEDITINKIGSLRFLDESMESISDGIKYLIEEECKRYVNTQVQNYYREELFLENILDAILEGDIFIGALGTDCYSGHGKKYFKCNRTNSINEVIADYDAIINSYKANVLREKLREIVGDDLVNLLDDFIDMRKEDEKNYIKKIDN